MRLTLLSLAVSAVLLAAGDDGNLLRNPSFEALAADRPWPADWIQLRGETVVLQEDGGHTGDHYVHFTDTDPKEGVSLESAHLPARPGGAYHASAWVRTTDKCRPGLYVQFHDELGTRIFEHHEQATGPTDGWALLESAAVAPDEAMEVSVLLYAYVGDVGDFDFDDVALKVEGGREPGSGRVPRAVPGEKDMVDIGNRRELFVDDYLVDSLTGDARRLLHHPQEREVALELNAPWEGATSIYLTVMQDDDRVRFYYRGSGDPLTTQVCSYAESTDGIHFTRPNLGIFDYEGSKDNSIVWTGEGSHNVAPFKDLNPAAPAEQRYKALCSAGPKASLVALVSPDGLHWSKLREEPVITDGAFDSQNLAFWDPVRGEYLAFYRDFTDGVRTIKVAHSDDFVTWTPGEWLDFGDQPKQHLYTNAITPYFRAPQILLGFPKRFVPERKKIAEHSEPGVSDGVLMSSRDTLHWQRWIEAFLRPGPDPERWTERNNAVGAGVVPASDTEIALYWVEHYRHPTCRIRRGTLRTDGFVSVHAGFDGGELLTRPLVFSGRSLEVNYATSAVGLVLFELCDAAGQPYPGFARAESEKLFGDEIGHTVTWGDRTDASELAGKPVRLRIYLKDADLYAFRFAD